MESRQGVLLIKGNALTRCRQTQSLQVWISLSAGRKSPAFCRPPLAYSDNHVVYRQMDVKRTLCQPSERLSSFVVSDEDGQLIQWATPLPSSVTRLTKKYRNKPYKAIETNWSWSPSKTWMQTIKKLDIKHCRTR